MERLTRADVDVTEYADKFLNTRLKGKEIDWKRTNDAGIDLLINAITCDEFSKDVFRQMARDLYGRLKQFEDTGLMPEEVLSMSGEWCAMMSVLNSVGVGYDRLRELAAADKDGRVVVLPCKVGDTVFARLDNKSKYVCECKVKQIVVGNIGFVTFAPIGVPEREYDVSLRGFGKTVFLSREEAEKAMKGETEK